MFFKLLIYNQIYGFPEIKTHHKLMFQLTLIVKNLSRISFLNEAVYRFKNSYYYEEHKQTLDRCVQSASIKSKYPAR
jgi:hypothetical protein